MVNFIVGLIILAVGYLFYGKLVESVLGPDDRETPARFMADGVDYVVLPKWKNMLIQLLNIAGVGPVIGVILGIKFGTIVFLIIPIGNIIGGAVHDFVAGMMSLRYGGANLPFLIRMVAGKGFARFFTIFMTILLLLVVAVFITTPAQLIDGAWKGNNIFWYAVVAIFLYYIAATLFPVDKIIGKVYPLFGALLLVGTAALFVRLLVIGFQQPELFLESKAFTERMFTPEKHQPILPLLFVTIACGILSGFHATQSPIVARTMKSEREAKATFYGMMVVEGFIAMVWAAGALVIYNLSPELMGAKAPAVLLQLTRRFLGNGVGAITIISVVILSITSGDTAMRSLRLSLAEVFSMDQTPIVNRVLLSLPLIALVTGLLWWSNQSAASFNQCWNYFAWGNQVLAACTLTAATAWLASKDKFYLVTLIPGVFMTFIVATYIFWISPAHGGPVGCGMELEYARIVGGFVAAVLAIWSVKRGLELKEGDLPEIREKQK